MLTQAPRGTKDVLPTDSYRWQHVEAHMRQAAAEAGKAAAAEVGPVKLCEVIARPHEEVMKFLRTDPVP